ncbi:MAG: DUF2953 domain-containing protein [Clostridium sp.]|uniref:DUF2953 domain-containing protein n=1 Tax=Clostridium sp. TaxID=1506 RepID=UPI003D6D6456
MFTFIIVFFFMLIIILFPIPIKITLKYSSKVLEIFIYNKKIDLKKSLENNRNKRNRKNNKTGQTNNTTTKSKKSSFKLLIINNIYDIKLIFYKIKTLKFKPTLILNTKVEYGLDDAALVAVLFGIMHSTYSSLHIILLNFVKVKNMFFNVIPHFEENDLYMKISSTIYINFATVIYMAFKLLPCLINIMHNKSNFKEYKGGNVHG